MGWRRHSPKPHSLPIGIVGPPAVAAAAGAQLGLSDPGGFEIHDYDSLTAAKTAILHRSVYGAFRPVPSPVLLVATAASPAVAVLLERGVGQLARPAGRSLIVQDVAPLPASDSTGATTPSAVLSLIIAGLIGTSLVYTFTRHRAAAVHVLATVTIGIGAGLVTALVTNFVVAAFPGRFFSVWGVATLFVLAIALPINAFQELFGIGGTAIGWILFLVIGNPASGASSAPELLPTFWRAVSQSLPPGAVVTSMRDAVYFNGHGSADALIVLALYSVVGAAGAMAVDRFRSSRTVTAAATT